MKFFAVNGSPRKNCNTAQLLDKSLEGVKSVFSDAETERIGNQIKTFNTGKEGFG